MIEAIVFSRRQAPQPRLSTPYVPGRHSERFWREEEDAVLKECFSKGGAGQCAEKLPSRSLGSIYQRARKLGLKGATGGPRTRRRSLAEFDEKIRQAWPTLTARGAIRAFADSIGVDRWIVSHRATALGLTRAHRVKEPNWTAAETALMAKVPLDRPDRAAAIFAEHGFKRSPTAIMVRATRLGVSRRRTDVLSGCAAAKILGVDEKWITARCIDGRITAEKRGTRRLVQQGSDTWSIRPADLRAFVVAHLEEVDIRKVEKFAFVALLTDPADG